MGLPSCSVLLLRLLRRAVELGFLYGVTRLVNRYVAFHFSSLRRQVPGPKSGSFWFGNFFQIRREPFGTPYMKWWKEARRQLHRKAQKQEARAGAAVATSKSKNCLGDKNDADEDGEAEKDLPHVPMICYSSLLGNVSLLILDKDIVKTVLTAPAGDPPRFGKMLAFVQNVAGDGLIVVEGDQWKRHRRILQPAFKTSFLRRSLEEVVPAKVERFVGCWRRVASVPDDDGGNANGNSENDERAAFVASHEIDVASHFSALTLDILGQVSFAYDFHGVDALEGWATKRVDMSNSNKKNFSTTPTPLDEAKTPAVDRDDDEFAKLDDPFLLAVQECFKFTLMTILTSILGMPFLDRMFNLTIRRNRATLDKAIDEVIAHNRRRNEESTDNTSPAVTTKTGNGEEGLKKEEVEHVQANSATTGKTQDDVNKECHRNSTGRHSGQKNKSLLQVLLETQDQPQEESGSFLSDFELRSEVKTFLLAGHETTSTWCYWALYALAKHPEVQEKVVRDITSHSIDGVESNKDEDDDEEKKSAGDEDSDPSPCPPSRITLEQVERMEYFQAFLQEVLRLYPPAGFLGRRTNFDEHFEIPTTGTYSTFCSQHGNQNRSKKGEGGERSKTMTIHIPKGTRIVVPTFSLHRHPLYWGDDAEEFRPERWLPIRSGKPDDDAKEEEQRRNLRSFVFLPFSAGGRNCIGQYFATVEAQLILAPIIRAFQVKVAPSQESVQHELTIRQVTMKTKPGLKIVLQTRQPRQQAHSS